MVVSQVHQNYPAHGIGQVYPVHNWGDNFDLFDKGGEA